ncbi:ATP-dependent Clp protease, protease subunit [Nonlabens sp. Hel1_33_55]|uniref:ClpP family protease n=1 Tax=Nonlabens sp. Hel1_33_55 TaxID=1336802 RepID=UPI000875DD68|nr:ATP-dependent Clp protease proteolytic subunit [Nonlabens sp. Hel1_33_55]SCX87431.1 ATP-dependent Clp protease, protease subunit [Nonlabens sp. Hel1_33_55]
MSKAIKLQDKIDEKFIEQRKLFIWGMVDDRTARHCVDRLLFLDSLSNEEITFVINSPGGYVTAGFSIYDTMQQLSSPVSTVCSGLAASMGSILLSGGKKGKRMIQKHGRVMIHQPSGGARGTGADLEITAAEILKTKELSAQILADNCGQTFEKVMKDFNRDYWMGADEAMEYGIVDGIV